MNDKVMRRHDDHAIDRLCSYIWKSYGRFPTLVQPLQLITFFQAHNLAVDYYDRFYPPGAHPETVKNHVRDWYGEDEE